MDQNTETWLKFRGNSIGASEIAIIMGLSPYKKRETLLREKAFPFPKSDKETDKDFIFQKGHNYEKKIRNFVEFDCYLSFPKTPTVIFSNPNYNTPIHASLDGITEDETIIIECKWMGQDSFHETKKTKKAPPHYMAQVQQQLLITGAKKCIFAFCREIKSLDGAGKPVIDLEYDYFNVLPDEEMQKKILVEAEKFWIEVLEMRESGPKDFSEIDVLVEQYQSNLHAMDLLNASQEILKAKIFEIAGKDKIERGNYTVQTVVSKGRETVDYKKYFTDSGIDVPKEYIKIGEPSISQRITFKKEKSEG